MNRYINKMSFIFFMWYFSKNNFTLVNDLNTFKNALHKHFNTWYNRLELKTTEQILFDLHLNKESEYLKVYASYFSTSGGILQLNGIIWNNSTLKTQTRGLFYLFMVV